jgi:hypothetical protein
MRSELSREGQFVELGDAVASIALQLLRDRSIATMKFY